MNKSQNKNTETDKMMPHRLSRVQLGLCSPQAVVELTKGVKECVFALVCQGGGRET